MSKSNNSGSSSGIGIGAVLAIIISWSINHSIFWAVVHGIFGWLYVLYWLGGCANVAQ